METFSRLTPGVTQVKADQINVIYDALESLNKGWIEIPSTWVYASSTTVTVDTDATARYKKGWRVRFKQGGAYQYYVMTIVAATLLTLDGGTVTVANAAITDVAISPILDPVGFPDYFDFVPSWTNFTPGDATITARKWFTGKTLDFEIYVVLGGTSSVSASGPITFVAPATLAAGAGYTVPVGQCLMFDSGTRYQGVVKIASSTTLGIHAVFTASTYASLSDTTSSVPFTWATADRLEIKGSITWA
ncbi:MAG: hypothetical protein CVU44_11375 [Chloroflexi bacterium HGW-Chloroflexi-6]|nr:MAG: hypothetical protein CVU44_11375 [Chloroflexi bacterium HGW-Chloroflexi-6]